MNFNKEYFHKVDFSGITNTCNCNFCDKTAGAYFGTDNLKEDIRKLVLPTYQPTKTLAWLEQQTGKKWNFYGSTLCCGEMLVYDVHAAELFSYEGKVLVTGCSIGEYISVTPREFIERIAKGAWV